MTYDKINFVDREVSRPKTYIMTTNSDNSVTLTDSFGTVTTLGTPLNAENMNHIEDGIANSATIDLDNLSSAGEIKVGKMEALPKASSELEGTIIQYTGETSGTLIKGYFYKCTKSGTSYTWESIEVQETPTVDTLDYTITTLSPSTTNFVEGTTYSVAQSIQRTANLFAGYKSNYIDNINAKIPAQASSTNQLADKDYVANSIASNAASFRGNWATWAAVPTDSSKYPEDASGSTTPTNNNYLVVQDATGYGAEYTGTWRFIYVGTWATDGKNGWKPTYQIGTAFTSAQQASLDSGATSTLIAQISTNASDIGDLKTDKLDKVYTSGNKVYGTNNEGAQVTYTAGTNINMNEVSSGSSKTYNISAIDTKVTQTVSTTNGDYPILAKASTAVTTTTDTSIFTSKVKVNPSTGNITATNFTGALVGNASTATADGSGNTISTYYEPKSNVTSKGSDTKPVYFNSSGVATAITSYEGTSAKATADASGNVITTTYATKIELAGQVLTLASSGTINLSTNSIYCITPSAAVTFVLPSVSSGNLFNQILVQVNMLTVYSINVGTSTYFNNKTPNLSSTGKYNLFFEYDEINNVWVCGWMKKGA